MNHQIKTTLCILACTLLGLQAIGQDIYQFRGANRDGFYQGKNLLEKWPETGPELLWSNEGLGGGFSAPTVTNNAVFITGKKDSLEFLTAFDKGGKQLWQLALGNAWTQTFPESRCTPTVEGDKVYVVTALGKIVCANTKDGSIVWSKEATKDYEGIGHQWGIAESLLLVDNKLIFTPAGPKTTMIALDKNSGEEIWKTESLKDTSHYTSPIVVEQGGKKVILGAAQNNAFAVDAAEGKILCNYTFANEKKPMCVNTPLFKDGQVLYTNGYGSYSYMLKLASDLSKLELVWKDTIMDSEYGYVVLKDGYVYGSNFLNSRKGSWCCIEWATGKLMYETAWQTKGPLSLVGDMLYCMDEKRGNVAISKANPEKFEVISTFRLPKGRGPCWSNPIVDDGIMYIRRGGALMAFNVSK